MCDFLRWFPSTQINSTQFMSFVHVWQTCLFCNISVGNCLRKEAYLFHLRSCLRGHLSRLSASEVSFVKQRDGISTYKGSCDDHMLIYMVMEDVSLIYRRAEGRDWQMHGPTWTNNICIMLLHKSPETSSSGIHS